jgi:Ca-activated chloride channel family protein
MKRIGLIVSAGLLVLVAAAEAFGAAAPCSAAGRPDGRDALAVRQPDGCAVPAGAAVLRIDDVTDGRLLLPAGEPGTYLAAPRVGTWVEMDVAGMIVRSSVAQRFYNPTDEWVEAIYAFPLPDGAAVDGLHIRVGDRFIEGRVEERKRARDTYERSAAKGQTSALVEQKRPNVFTSSVANIGPGEEVVVQIEYQQTLAYRDGGFSLRFPMVVAPRYGQPAEPSDPSLAGTVGSGDDAFTVAMAPRGQSDVDPVELEIRLAAGFALDMIDSPSHSVEVREIAGGGHLISLANGTARANRDFVLEWKPAVGAAPLAEVFEERVGDHVYQLLLVMPPVDREAVDSRQRREVVFVIDTSGSMAGRSLREAQAALLLALDRLHPEDRFNVIRFDSTTELLHPSAVAATPTAIERAKQWVASLDARGGTEMAAALSGALAGVVEPGRLRQVVFVTDGQVQDEAALFDLLRDRLGETRLFTVGIGSAPNSYFMRKAAENGRGSFVHIGDVDEVEERMNELVRKLERPALTDIEVDFSPALGVEVFPRTVPDLYAGEPVMVVTQWMGAALPITVRGRQGDDTWEVKVQSDSERDSVGIARVWAGRKLEAFSDSIAQAGIDAEQRDKLLARATRVALEHQLASPFTSLVAVDVEPRRRASDVLSLSTVRVEPPAGWRHRAAFAAPPVEQQQWDATRIARLRTVAAHAPGHARLAANRGERVLLPQGGTDAQVRMIMGALALFLGLVGMAADGRRTIRLP